MKHKRHIDNKLNPLNYIATFYDFGLALIVAIYFSTRTTLYENSGGIFLANLIFLLLSIAFSANFFGNSFRSSEKIVKIVKLCNIIAKLALAIFFWQEGSHAWLIAFAPVVGIVLNALNSKNEGGESSTLTMLKIGTTFDWLSSIFVTYAIQEDINSPFEAIFIIFTIALGLALVFGLPMLAIKQTENPKLAIVGAVYYIFYHLALIVLYLELDGGIGMILLAPTIINLTLIIRHIKEIKARTVESA